MEWDVMGGGGGGGFHLLVIGTSKTCDVILLLMSQCNLL